MYKFKDVDDERLYVGGFYRDVLSFLTYKNILQLKETCLIKNSEPLNREFTERKISYCSLMCRLRFAARNYPIPSQSPRMCQDAEAVK